MRWYRKAADQGNAGAQLSLGVMYSQGHGLPQDFVEAVRWYRKAADQGNAYAQSLLAISYRDGKGIPQDYVQAHKWFNLAVSQLSPTDESRADIRNSAERGRESIASKMTPAQIAQAQKLAREWKPKPER